jgi:hypothetical protein
MININAYVNKAPLLHMNSLAIEVHSNLIMKSSYAAIMTTARGWIDHVCPMHN